MSSFGWLHLTDLHQGMGGQACLWPNIREEFFTDLEKLHTRCGPWDFVCFTGDLTQRGSAAEFGALTVTLQRLWEHLQSLGSRPVLVTVPGNHDLVRPDAKEPTVKLLGQWGTDIEVMRDFWDDPTSSYRAAVHRAFEPYTAWAKSHPLPQPAARADGMLPGDFSATLELGGLKIGVLGLNSAFLQLTDANFEGRLDLHAKQFHAACGGDGVDWAACHDICLLLTHHPVAWLREAGRITLRGEIAPPPRFAIHLFGHMHEGRSEMLAVNDDDGWYSLQGPSLFGLEQWGQSGESRVHGYSAGRIQIDGGGAYRRLWPRAARRTKEGVWRVAQDVEWRLEEDQGTKPKTVPLRRKAVAPKPVSPAPIVAPARATLPSAATDIAALIRQFNGGNPVTGTQALHELLALGDVAESMLFEGTIGYPRTVQERRRWLAYVAGREATVAERLLERLRDPVRFNDSNAAAFLLAGIASQQPAVQQALGEMLKDAPYDKAHELLLAWGYSGGEPSYLWHRVARDWDKLAASGFSGACASVARVNPSSLWALDQFVTHQEESGHLESITGAPDEPLSNDAIGAQDLWHEAHLTFLMWRRGDVADAILRDWSGHAHWRVRDFGAQVLGALGFSRTATPVMQWLLRESVPSIREALVRVLARGGATHGADLLLDNFLATREGLPYVAAAAWRATDRSKAISILKELANHRGLDVAPPALVTLARLGHRPDDLSARLDNPVPYLRSTAALAIAALGDKSERPRLVAMQRQAADSMERVCLAAALAILGQPEGAAALHAELVRASETNYGPTGPLDIFRLADFLQDAILAGLAAGGAAGQSILDAWRLETEPLPAQT